MSVSASLDFKMWEGPTGKPSPTTIINALRAHGWSLTSEGEILYLPLGDHDDFDWQRGSSESELLEVVRRKEAAAELVGVLMTCQGSGGNFLFWPSGDFSVSLCYNRKVLDESTRITDVNWYLARILPALSRDDVHAVWFSFEQTT